MAKIARSYVCVCLNGPVGVSWTNRANCLKPYAGVWLKKGMEIGVFLFRRVERNRVFLERFWRVE